MSSRAPGDEARVDGTARIRAAARKTFGWPRLRPGQLDAMRAVLAGRDTLVVMPTGSGKSACYQVPGVLLDGPTVVVSPLIALQHDQAGALDARGAATNAASVNSTDTDQERREAFGEARSGELEYLFLSPEQLAREDVVSSVAAARPSLVVVDEAHCVSAWGHDFRPDYLRLGQVIERLGHPTVLALTATAAPPVREEIVRRLGMRDPLQVVRGFDRPNLWLDVERFGGAAEKRAAVLTRALTEPKPGIVYAATRRETEQYAGALAELGVRAAAYHAGLTASLREQVQAAFMADRLDVVVATTAFGMGIDKPNVRFVLHASVAESLDSYYQEIGRAGRDGAAARALLLYRVEDLGLRRFFASGGLPDEQDLAAVVVAVRDRGHPLTRAELAAATGIKPRRLTGLVNLLEEAGALAGTAAGRLVPGGLTDPRAAGARARELVEAHRQVERSRVEMMRGYAETTGCRRQYLLGYFGEVLEQPCGRCDNCAAGRSRAEPDGGGATFAVNTPVVHASWGPGIVMRYEGDRIVVLFERAGYRTLDLDLVHRNGLLQRA